MVGPSTAGLSLEVSAKSIGDEVTSYLTVGIWFCGIILDEDVVSAVDSSVDLKECVEYSTSADSGCNDSGCARCFGIANAAEPT